MGVVHHGPCREIVSGEELTIPTQPADAPGPAMPIAWILVAMFTTSCSCLAVGAMAYDAETAGIIASKFAAFPLCAAVSAAAAAIPIHVVIKHSPALRLALPPAIGCLGGAVGLGGLLVFYAAIWPAL